MVSTITLNRQKKVTLLKSCMMNIIDLLLMEHRGRDAINMARFKALNLEIEEMKEIAIKFTSSKNISENT